MGVNIRSRTRSEKKNKTKRENLRAAETENKQPEVKKIASCFRSHTCQMEKIEPFTVKTCGIESEKET
jgi:hypothetical protein